MDQLEKARRRLYDVFAGCALPEVISYCTYCDDDAYERGLHAPLEELAEPLVEKYVRDAFHHTGGAREFQHFLPRVLELFVSNRYTADPEIIARCLRQSEPATWPEGGAAAVGDYLATALVNEVATAEPWDVSRFADYVALGLDLGRLAAGWPRDLPGATALGRLVFLEETFRALADVPPIEPGALPPHPDLASFVSGEGLALLRVAVPQLSADVACDLEIAIAYIESRP